MEQLGSTSYINEHVCLPSGNETSTYHSESDPVLVVVLQGASELLGELVRGNKLLQIGVRLHMDKLREMRNDQDHHMTARNYVY